MPKEKIWTIATRDDEAVKVIAETLGIGFPTACLLYDRGYTTPETAMAFIRLEDELFHDPFLMADMKKAADRVVTAIENGERVAVYGDYDVDGVTAVSVLCLYLREKGAKVSYYIPNRVGEGYGINREALKKLSYEGNTLIITVDTGITAHGEAEYCRELGCDMIITDHHECQETIPSAFAVVNPHRHDCPYPFKELAGVGVAFKLVTAVEYTLRSRAGLISEGFLSDVCRKYIDLAALGTIADVMPLKDENRLIASLGLNLMEKAPRPGIKALLDASDSGKTNKKRRINSSVVGYTIAPRINAAGRISSASIAAELFLSENIDNAYDIANELCEINIRRQAEENKIADEIKARIEADPSLGESPVIVLENEGWNHGVIGIVASRITEKYGRPSILISFENGIGKGSGRSVKGLNLAHALAHCSELLIKYGGHELAAGLTVEKDNLEEFKAKINAYAKSILGGGEPEVTLNIDLELKPSEINLKQAAELELLEPYGVSNPMPTFALRDVNIVDIVPMGQARHTKFVLEKNSISISAVMFGTGPDELSFSPGDEVDVAFRLGINEFQGIKSAQALVRDIRYTELSKSENTKDYVEYISARRGLDPVNAECIPNRQDFVSVYLYLKRALSSEGEAVGVRKLLYALNQTPVPNCKMSYVKLRLVLDIMNEMGIIVVFESGEGNDGREIFTIRVPRTETKVDLERSCIYSQLMKSKKTSSIE